jgi:hypothetical protein
LNVAQLPFIYKWVAAMPDVHWGIGLSVRASASLPSNCSGDMYRNVPRTVPCFVSLRSSAVTAVSPAPFDALFVLIRYSEIQQLGTRFSEHDVAWLKIAMNDSQAVGLVQRVRDLNPVLENLLQRQGPSLKPMLQCLAFQVLEHTILMTNVVQCADVRVGKLRDRSGLLLKSLPQLWAVCQVGRKEEP